MSTSPIWLRFEKQHPDASPWPPATLDQEKSTDHGVELIFSYPVRVCHACKAIASLYIGYQFTNEGRFLKANVLAVK